MDYLWHWFEAINSFKRFPLFTGVGGHINTGAGYKNSAAVRECSVLRGCRVGRRSIYFLDLFLRLRSCHQRGSASMQVWGQDFSSNK
jgi:hypothetical protein